MNGVPSEGEDVFPGSRGSAHLLEWIDRQLVELREGRLNDARAALESEEWRALDLPGLPAPIVNQLRESLDHAAEALGHPAGSVEDAEAALLMARSRLVPGA